MPDVQFPHPRQRRDRLDIDVIQGVPRIEPHPELTNQFARVVDLLQLGNHRRRPDVPPRRPERRRVRPRVDFADGKPAGRRRFDLALVGVDERTDDQARRPQPMDHLLDAGPFAGNVQPALRGDFLPALGHQHHQIRLDLAGNRDHLVRRCHFQVELHVHQFVQSAEVIILNVSTVLAEMDGDAIGPPEVCFDRSPDGVGLVGATSLPDGGDVINVHAKFNHGRQRTTRDDA